jgi:hypothetical protein
MTLRRHNWQARAGLERYSAQQIEGKDQTMLFVRILAGLALAGAMALPATAQSLVLKGAEGQSRTLSLTELAAMPHQTVTMTDHGHTRSYSGVPVSALIALVGAPQGEALHGKAIDDLVVVSAADGYRVVLALAETDPAMRSEQVIVADRAEGAPLDAHEGPLRLIVEGDKRPARSAREVQSIEVRLLP